MYFDGKYTDRETRIFNQTSQCYLSGARQSSRILLELFLLACKRNFITIKYFLSQVLDVFVRTRYTGLIALSGKLVIIYKINNEYYNIFRHVRTLTKLKNLCTAYNTLLKIWSSLTGELPLSNRKSQPNNSGYEPELLTKVVCRIGNALGMLLTLQASIG